jgi:hypothetical protein
MISRAHALFTREILRVAADPGLVEPLASPCPDWDVTTERLEDGAIRVAIAGSVLSRGPGKWEARERIIPAQGQRSR